MLGVSDLVAKSEGRTAWRWFRQREEDRPEGWREPFEAELRELFARRLRIAAAVLVVLHSAAFLVFDTSTIHGTDLGIRIGVIPVTLLFAATTFVPVLRRRAPKITVVFVLSLVAFIVWNNANIVEPTKVEALLLVIPGCSLLFPFSARAAGVLGALALFVYLGLVALMNFGLGNVTGWMASTFYVACAGVLATLGSGVAYRLREREYLQRLEIDRAREQVEGLLLNTLPHTIVDRLKDGEEGIADRHDEATVLFTDICGFTELSSEVHPDRLVQFLNGLFSELDALCERYGLEKIKTIGDAYMVAGGLPEPLPEHAHAVARMALAMREVTGAMTTPLGNPLRMRIGIHTGPVVAGVIGRRKLIYDLWGDTVNTAARMESHAEPGMIQVTSTTFERLTGSFELRPRGSIAVKGKGTMRTYELVGELVNSQTDAPAPVPAAG